MELAERPPASERTAEFDVSPKAKTAQRIQQLLDDRAEAMRERDALRLENAQLLKENESLLHENDRLRSETRQDYQRGREDMRREIVFAQRLTEARAKFADFDAVWQQVRSQVPRAVLEEIGNLPNGLDAGYFLRRNPALCAELVGLPPEQARLRFRSFADDLKFFGGKP